MLYFLDLTVADNVVTQFADGSRGSMFVWALNTVLKLRKTSESLK